MGTNRITIQRGKLLVLILCSLPLYVLCYELINYALIKACGGRITELSFFVSGYPCTYSCDFLYSSVNFLFMLLKVLTIFLAVRSKKSSLLLVICWLFMLYDIGHSFSVLLYWLFGYIDLLFFYYAQSRLTDLGYCFFGERFLLVHVVSVANLVALHRIRKRIGLMVRNYWNKTTKDRKNPNQQG